MQRRCWHVSSPVLLALFSEPSAGRGAAGSILTYSQTHVAQKAINVLCDRHDALIVLRMHGRDGGFEKMIDDDDNETKIPTAFEPTHNVAKRERVKASRDGNRFQATRRVDLLLLHACLLP